MLCANFHLKPTKTSSKILTQRWYMIISSLQWRWHPSLLEVRCFTDKPSLCRSSSSVRVSLLVSDCSHCSSQLFLTASQTIPCKIQHQHSSIWVIQEQPPFRTSLADVWHRVLVRFASDPIPKMYIVHWTYEAQIIRHKTFKNKMWQLCIVIKQSLTVLAHREIGEAMWKCKFFCG